MLLVLSLISSATQGLNASFAATDLVHKGPLSKPVAFAWEVWLWPHAGLQAGQTGIVTFKGHCRIISVQMWILLASYTNQCLEGSWT